MFSLQPLKSEGKNTSTSKKRIALTALEDEDHNDSKRIRLEDQIITEITDGKIVSAEEEVKEKPVVIPLLRRTVWRNADRQQSTTDRQECNTQTQNDDEDQAAVRALNAESAGAQNATTQPELTVPMLSLNAVPGVSDLGTETEKYKHDLSLRPSEPTLDSYSNIPIEEFGKAMLRGMGWKEGGAIGRNKKNALLEPKIYEPRPQLLGLGAKPAMLEPKKEKKYIKPGEKRETPIPVIPDKRETTNGRRSQTPATSEDRNTRESSYSSSSSSARDTIQSINVQDTVLIKYGEHKGQKGKVVQLKERSKGLVAYVELKDGEELKIYADEVEVISSSSTSKSKSQTSSQRSWVTPSIVVYIHPSSSISSRYHNQYATIVDIPAPYTATLRLPNKETTTLQQKYLQTVVPSVGKSVVVVDHQDASLIGRKGTILEKDRKREECVVQLEDYEVVKCMYDDVSENVG